MSLRPLTDDEAGLLYTIGMMGSQSYPIQKIGSRWHWTAWRGVKGSPVVYKTKKAAVAAFETWYELARARWAEMKQANRNLMLTAVGIKKTS